MSKKRVPQLKAPNANRPRNAFDLSQKHLFTAPVGALLPVMSLDLMPHDHVEIQATDFMRCLPMNSAAFMSLRGVYEFFAVPYSQLYHPVDQILTGMKDFRSNLLRSYDSKSYIPSCTLRAVHNYLDRYKDMGLSATDIFGFKEYYNSCRLLDLLGYGAYKGVDVNFINGSKGAQSYKVTPLRACAYQKIYFDYYANNTYETYDPDFFNFDNLRPGQDVSAEHFVKNFLKLRYRNAPVDYLTNVRPSPLFDDGSIASYFDEAGVAGRNNIDGVLGNTNSGVNLITANEGGKETRLDINTLRAGFALDKLLRITMQAGKTYSEQIAAHFGFNVSEGRDGKVHYLGGFDSNLQVGDVVQTSGTTVMPANVSQEYGGYLGRVTGKAQGSGSGRITYDAKEHCILMCIYSAVPDMQYDSERIDPFVVKKQRGDFFLPEFENLGMQALDGQFVSYHNSGFVGWQPRYSEYKTALDINHGQFRGKQPLSYWTISRSRSWASAGSFTIKDLKISPRWVDDVFAVNYNGTEETDCLFGGCQFNIQKVSDMSEIGMPRI